MENSNVFSQGVNKRPWPLTGAIGTIVTVIGLIKWFLQYCDRLLGIGAIITVLTIIQWWRDNPVRNISRITHKDSNERAMMRNNSIAFCNCMSLEWRLLPMGGSSRNIWTIIIIIIINNCSWVVTRWQWLFYMYTKHEIVYY